MRPLLFGDTVVRYDGRKGDPTLGYVWDYDKDGVIFRLHGSTRDEPRYKHHLWASLEIAKVQDPKQLEEQYGLKSGDVLTEVDGEKIEQSWQLSKKLENSFSPSTTKLFKSSILL